MKNKASEESKRFLKLFLTRNEARLGLTIVAVFFAISFIVAIAGKSVLPYDPIKQNVGPILGSPTWSHLFGTDNLGRDVFSRIVFATPNDLVVSFAVITSSFLVGIVLGGIAGFWGGILDEILMRTTDVIFAIPALILAMSIAVILGPGLIHMMYALMIIWWPPYARLARGESLQVSQKNFVESAKTSGTGTLKILRKHLVPNILNPMLAYATLDIGTVVVVYAGLSYLGLSVQPPTPDWGAMVSAYQDYLISAPWLPLFPAVIIAAVVIGFSLLGNALRDTVESQNIS
jgi:peptide/nickel transport system permease protein